MQSRLMAALAVLTILCACTCAQAGALNAPAGYVSIDTPLNMPAGGWFGGFDILPNGNFVIHDGYGIREITRAGETVGVLYTYPSKVYGSFVKYNSCNRSVYFGDSTTSSIMCVSLRNGMARKVASLAWNFDAEFCRGQLYAVAKTSIYRVNERTGECDAIATLGETSGPITFDKRGNLIYGMGDYDWSTPRDQKIVMWTADQVRMAGNGVMLAESDAEVLATGVSAYGFAWKNNRELLFSETVYPAAIMSLSDDSAYAVPANAFDSITYVRVDGPNGAVTAAVSYFDEFWNQHTVLSSIVPRNVRHWQR